MTPPGSANLAGIGLMVLGIFLFDRSFPDLAPWILFASAVLVAGLAITFVLWSRKRR